jgi:LPXTG-motif cell wall-anchored protein
VLIKELPVAENIWILGLAILAIIAAFAILLFSKKTKNTE